MECKDCVEHYQDMHPVAWGSAIHMVMLNICGTTLTLGGDKPLYYNRVIFEDGMG